MKIINKKGLDDKIKEIDEFVKKGNSKPYWFSDAMWDINKIPEIFKDIWIDNCDKRIIDHIVKIEDLLKNKIGLYLYGNCGTGKTYSLYAIYKNFRLNKIKCRIENTVELLRLFKKDFNDKYSNNFEEYLEYTGVLFIDDIGAEKNSEFVDETLYHLINTRYEKMLPTFFTSNLSLKELAEKNGDRLVSRIAGMCEILKLEGKDKRIN